MLVEQLPQRADIARWDTVLRGEFASRDDALEAGRVAVERQEQGEPEMVAEDRRFVAVPFSYFKPRIARVKRTEQLVWEDG